MRRGLREGKKKGIKRISSARLRWQASAYHDIIFSGVPGVAAGDAAGRGHAEAVCLASVGVKGWEPSYGKSHI